MHTSHHKYNIQLTIKNLIIRNILVMRQILTLPIVSHVHVSSVRFELKKYCYEGSAHRRWRPPRFPDDIQPLRRLFEDLTTQTR